MNMELETRLLRFLTKRLSRLQRLDLLEAAACKGLVDAVPVVSGSSEDGMRWTSTATLANLFEQEGRTASKVFYQLIAEGHLAVNEKRLLSAASYDEPWTEPKGTRRTAGQQQGECSSNLTSAPADRGGYDQALERLVDLAAPPSPASVAVALLVSRGLAQSFSSLEEFRQIARRAKPSVLVRAQVPGFERHFGELLEEGALLPYWCAMRDVFGRAPLTPDRTHRREGKHRRTVLTASGRGLKDALDGRGLQKIAAAQRFNSAPFLIVDETTEPSLDAITALVDRAIDCGPLDNGIVALVIQNHLEARLEDVANAMTACGFSSEGLALDDLNLGIRPDRRVEDSLRSLTQLAKFRLAANENSDASADRNSKTTTSSSRLKTRTAETASVTIIQPETASSDAGTSARVADGQAHTRNIPTVENLAGYGEAKKWALDLKADLDFWRSGQVAWCDLSSKILLSGPPGTGKTLFARALCNSLGLPLIVTSVAGWLEPGYLGDVLQQMTAAFKAAEEAAPAILFIDELDNIGNRSKTGSGRHDEYWISLINRLLVLLDGSTKTRGVVVVGATNRPEAIDPALLRSGRLETQVQIELPDVTALTDILLHHLGSDLDQVLRTKPKAMKQSSVSRQAENRSVSSLKMPVSPKASDGRPTQGERA